MNTKGSGATAPANSTVSHSGHSVLPLRVHVLCIDVGCEELPFAHLWFGLQVFCNYVLKLPNGKLIDESKGKPFSFKLGCGEVIR